MRALTVVVLMTVTDRSAMAAGKTQIHIYMNDHDESALLLGPGIPLASSLFDKIGVKLVWHDGARPAGVTGYALRTLKHAPEAASAEALAGTQMGVTEIGEIAIYRDRVSRFLMEHSNLKNVAAGYVLAHELGHAIEGMPRHSDSGIMKAHWSPDDFQNMVFHKLVFAPIDAELIRGRLAAKSSSQTSQVGQKDKK